MAGTLATSSKRPSVVCDAICGGSGGGSGGAAISRKNRKRQRPDGEKLNSVTSVGGSDEDLTAGEPLPEQVIRSAMVSAGRRRAEISPRVWLMRLDRRRASG